MSVIRPSTCFPVLSSVSKGSVHVIHETSQAYLYYLLNSGLVKDLVEQVSCQSGTIDREKESGHFDSEQSAASSVRYCSDQLRTKSEVDRVEHTQSRQPSPALPLSLH